MNPDWLTWVFFPFGWQMLILGPAIMIFLGWLWGKLGQSDD